MCFLNTKTLHKITSILILVCFICIKKLGYVKQSGHLDGIKWASRWSTTTLFEEEFGSIKFEMKKKKKEEDARIGCRPRKLKYNNNLIAKTLAINREAPSSFYSFHFS